MQKTAISWSGGKDCCLALIRARAAGLNVTTFLTMCEEDGLSKSHALSPALIEAQVVRLGGEWVSVRVPAGRYGAAFAGALASLVATGHTRMVFGDIDLQAHREWLEPACARAGLEAVFPLWGAARRALSDEILERGLRACVVGVDTARLDADWCGVEYTRTFIRALPPGVCPVGEDGEFHTFVFDAPGMSSPVLFTRGERRLVASAPPLSPTRLAFQCLRLLDGQKPA